MSTYTMTPQEMIMTYGSTRGAQVKFYKEGYWYKIDGSGPEGLAEDLSSKVLEYSSLDKSDYVNYEKCVIEYGGKQYNGCRSANFLSYGEQFFSYSKIYKIMTGRELEEDIIVKTNPKERIDYVNEYIHTFTGLDVHDYISNVLTIDAFLLNTDRHLNNMGVIVNPEKNEYRNAPIFDNGEAFLSDYSKYPPSDYPIDKIDVHSNIFGKPFSPDLEYQAFEAGLTVRFDFIGMKNIFDKEPELYNTRSGQILMHQIETYCKLPDLNKITEKSITQNHRR